MSVPPFWQLAGRDAGAPIDYWTATLSIVAVLLSVLRWAVTARPAFALAAIVTLVVANCDQVIPFVE